MTSPRKRSAVGVEPAVCAGDELLPEMLGLIRGAARTLRIVLPAVPKALRLELELQEAVKRGVEVRVLIGSSADATEEAIATALGGARRWLQNGAFVKRVPESDTTLVLSETRALVLSAPLSEDGEAPPRALGFLFEATRHAATFGKLRAWAEALDADAFHSPQLPNFASYAGEDGEVGLIVTTAVPASERRRNPQARALARAKRRSRQGAHQPRPGVDDEPGACISCGLDIVFRPDKPLCRDCFEDWAPLTWDDREGKYCHACGELDVVREETPFCHECEDAV